MNKKCNWTRPRGKICHQTSYCSLAVVATEQKKIFKSINWISRAKQKTNSPDMVLPVKAFYFLLKRYAKELTPSHMLSDACVSNLLVRAF
jgi:hypothetical protein